MSAFRRATSDHHFDAMPHLFHKNDYNVHFPNRHRQLYAWNKHLLAFGRCVFLAVNAPVSGAWIGQCGSIRISLFVWQLWLYFSGQGAFLYEVGFNFIHDIYLFNGKKYIKSNPSFPIIEEEKHLAMSWFGDCPVIWIGTRQRAKTCLKYTQGIFIPRRSTISRIGKAS